MKKITWRCAPFAQLTPREIHDMFQARSAAFVVEQDCVFLDIDGIDPECWHLVGYATAPGGDALGPRRHGDDEPRAAATALVACARLVPPGVRFAEPSIGRVVTTDAVRGTGMGRELMKQALAQAAKLWPGQAIRIGAQQHLEKFYASLGFARASEPYDEDGIPHIEMLRPASTVPERSARTVGQ
jgi:ElaA protein